MTDLREFAVAAGVSAWRVELVAQQQSVTPLSGRVEAWTFGSLPGPTLTARVGETLEVTLRNRDIADGVTLHLARAARGQRGGRRGRGDPGRGAAGESFNYRLRFDCRGRTGTTPTSAAGGYRPRPYGALVVQPAMALVLVDPGAAGPCHRLDDDPGRSDEVLREMSHPARPCGLAFQHRPAANAASG